MIITSNQRDFLMNDIDNVILNTISQTYTFVSEVPNSVLDLSNAREMSNFMVNILPDVHPTHHVHGRTLAEIREIHHTNRASLTGGDTTYTSPLLRKYLRMFAQSMTISQLFPFANRRFECINNFRVNSSHPMNEGHYTEFVRDGYFFSGIYAESGDGYAMRISYDASTYKLKIQIGNRNFEW
jgi:hypothetical protein